METYFEKGEEENEKMKMKFLSFFIIYVVRVKVVSVDSSIFDHYKYANLSQCPGGAFKSHWGKILFVFKEDSPTGMDTSVHKFYRVEQMGAISNEVELFGQYFCLGRGVN